jgi:hypothetical protein
MGVLTLGFCRLFCTKFKRQSAYLPKICLRLAFVFQEQAWSHGSWMNRLHENEWMWLWILSFGHRLTCLSLEHA